MFSGQYLTAAQAQTFFSQTNGIGLSILREGIPDNASVPGNCGSVSSSCVPGAVLNNMQLAIAQNPNLKIFATVFSPPASMKTNGSVNCSDNSGGGTLISSDYGQFATWMSNWIGSVESLYSITPYAVSVQNEPEECESYDSSLLSSSEFDTFIKTNLQPTMASAGQSAVKIMMPEPDVQSDLTGYAGSCMGDGSCSPYVGIVAVHNYDFGAASSNPYSTSAQYWETEVSGCALSATSANYAPCAYTGAMNPDGLYWAYNIWSWMTQANANAWVWWALIPYGGSGAYPNTGLMNPDGLTMPQRLWAVGNYSKFIQPGYVRIDATANPRSGVYLSAFQDLPSGTVVIVAINSTGSDVSQTFSIANGPNFNSVMPWITSASLNLAQQSAISVSSNSFAYSLPASSVTTFVGSSGSPGPAQSVVPDPPTDLVAVIGH